MPITLPFACDLRHGLHTRPASLIAQIAEKARSTVLVRKPGTTGADARSVLSVIALDIQPGHEWEIVVEGEDEGQIAAQLQALVRSRFGEPEVDPQPPMTESSRLPRLLTRLGVTAVKGRPAASGVAIGKLVRLRATNLSDLLSARKPDGLAIERERLIRAAGIARIDLENRAKRATGTAGELLAAHRAMLDDPQWQMQMDRKVAAGLVAERAVVDSAAAFQEKLLAASSPLIRERAADVHDLAVWLLEAMGIHSSAQLPRPEVPSILICETLTAGQLLGADLQNIAGLVLGDVGLTSHAVLLARSNKIPALVGAASALVKESPATTGLLDGDRGFLATDPPPALIRLYDVSSKVRERFRRSLMSFAQRPGRSQDGTSMEIGANASSGVEVQTAIAEGADGVGLFRTEFLYLGRREEPSESELTETFAAAVRHAGGKPLIFRTIDIGADKPAPFLPLTKEENPFLGVRGARLYPEFVGLLQKQLVAIAKVAASNVRIMAPMVTNPAEMVWFRDQVRNAERAAAAMGCPAQPLSVGMMLETPAAAAAVPSFAPHADFFSVGTNDLAQYWFAADRGNAAVARLIDQWAPSFLQLLGVAVRDAHAAGKWIGLCGDMASDPANLPILLGLGFDEISVAGVNIAELKHRLSKLSSSECRQMIDESLQRGGDIRAGCRRLRGGQTSQPVSEDLIILDSEAISKEEAIREAVEILAIAGRTDLPGELEEDVWTREETYSTGLGHGFAVPHCRSSHITGVSIAVGRLKTPVEWGSTDGQPVRHVLLLAVPADLDAKAHLQVLARLARKLMHEEFRSSLENSSSAADLARTLRRELQLSPE